jgi:pimeloyl-ACP methyl ester carboxylesterase
MRVALAPPLARLTWNAYLPSLYAGTKPADFDAYRTQVSSALKRPGYAKAFSQTTRLSHQVAKDRLNQVNQPMLVVMGEMDPDFPDPAAEARWIAENKHATVLMVPDAGHYPHVQQPALVTPAVLEFLNRLPANG